jgi:hypothetical protein
MILHVVTIVIALWAMPARASMIARRAIIAVADYGISCTPVREPQ